MDIAGGEREDAIKNKTRREIGVVSTPDPGSQGRQTKEVREWIENRGRW